VPARDVFGDGAAKTDLEIVRVGAKDEQVHGVRPRRRRSYVPDSHLLRYCRR
jgi:hypothetical protein